MVPPSSPFIDKLQLHYCHLLHLFPSLKKLSYVSRSIISMSQPTEITQPLPLICSTTTHTINMSDSKLNTSTVEAFLNFIPSFIITSIIIFILTSTLKMNFLVLINTRLMECAKGCPTILQSSKSSSAKQKT